MSIGRFGMILPGRYRRESSIRPLDRKATLEILNHHPNAIPVMPVAHTDR